MRRSFHQPIARHRRCWAESSRRAGEHQRALGLKEQRGNVSRINGWLKARLMNGFMRVDNVGFGIKSVKT
jgi:hypothetical protein